MIFLESEKGAEKGFLVTCSWKKKKITYSLENRLSLVFGIWTDLNEVCV